MTATVSKAWWLPALCALFDLAHAAINVAMMSLSLTYRWFGSPVRASADIGFAALCAGACAVLAALWIRGKQFSWLLAVHGLALAAFGGILFSPLVKGSLSFRWIAPLFIVMAASLGAYALELAKSAPRSRGGRWFPMAAGIASMLYALSFVAVGFFIRRLEPPYAYFVWMSSFFMLCAAVMAWLSVRGLSQSENRSARERPLSPMPLASPGR